MAKFNHDPMYPYVRIGKIRSKIDNIIEQKLNDQENSYGYIAGPLRKQKVVEPDNVPEPELQSGKILDPDINIYSADHSQRELLRKAGLSIDQNADVRVIKDKEGNLKAAIAIKRDEKNAIKQLNYIDVDKDDKYFKKAIGRLGTIPGGVSMQKQKVEVFKEEINPLVLIED